MNLNSGGWVTLHGWVAVAAPGFPSGGRQPQGEGPQIHYLAKLSRKLYENEKKTTIGLGVVVVVSPAPQDPPTGCAGVWSIYHSFHMIIVFKLPSIIPTKSISTSCHVGPKSQACSCHLGGLCCRQHLSLVQYKEVQKTEDLHVLLYFVRRTCVSSSYTEEEKRQGTYSAWGIYRYYQQHSKGVNVGQLAMGEKDKRYLNIDPH